MMFARFRNAITPITAHVEQVDEWTQAITFENPMTYVALVSDKAIWSSDVLLTLLKQNGYRALERDLSMRTMRYVRPLPLWVAHWVGVRSYWGFWLTVRWLYRHKIIRLANTPAVPTRLRDIRPWPLKGYRHETNS
jgi:hypothetical protein